MGAFSKVIEFNGERDMKTSVLTGVLLITIFLSGLFSGCTTAVKRPPSEAGTPDHMVKLIPERIPLIEDDLDRASLVRAIEKSLVFLDRIPEDRLFKFGRDTYTAREMKESLILFYEIMGSTLDNRRLAEVLRKKFNVYQCLGLDGEGSILYTGYYEPVLEGSKFRTSRFKYPIYRVPDDHIVVNLGQFRKKYEGERIIARIEDGKVVPYYTRRDIDVDDRLACRGLEIAWLADPVDIFFLHIQGSGMIEFTDGTSIQVSYSQSNGHAYRSLGRHLVEEGKLSIGEISLEGIKKYLNTHPDEMFDLLSHNQSYVFFRIVEEGPKGCLDVPVTGGRSIATDPAFFPQGALAFIKVKKPVINEDGNIISWVPFSRFVLNQDTGGAIKGPARVDLFCGTGSSAGIMAGHMKEYGELYFFIKKHDR